MGRVLREHCLRGSKKSGKNVVSPMSACNLHKCFREHGCPHCTKRYKTISNLTKHMQDQHPHLAGAKPSKGILA